MDDLAAGFFSLFAGLDRAHGTFAITRKNQSKNKIEGRAVTEHKAVTVELWEKHLTGKQGLGIIPIMDNACVWWGAIDIDRYDIDLLALEKQVKSMDLPLFLCRTKSGGAHLYVFMEEMTSAKLVRQKMSEFSVALGHPGVEIYPKQVSLASENDVGNWLNMPYFNGNNTERYCIHLGQKLSAQDFLTLAMKYRISEATLKNTIPFSSSDFADGPPCLQTLAARGFAEGGRNKALFNIGVYTRLKNPDSWEADLEQCNHQYMQPPLPSREVIALTKSVGRKDYGYTCKQDPISSVCNAEVCKGRPFGVKTHDENISLVIGSLVKITSTPPTWIIDVEGHRLELRTEDLLNQEAFRKICVEKINKFPPKVKPHTWEKMIQEKLENVEEQIAPPDAAPEGRLDYLLKQFCASYMSNKNIDELLSGKAWHDEEKQRVYFRYPDFNKYLVSHHFVEMTSREVWAYFRRMGADHHQFNIKGTNVQCWYIKEQALNLEELEIIEGDNDASF